MTKEMQGNEEAQNGDWRKEEYQCLKYPLLSVFMNE
jgi:hypothetical protein